MDERNVIVRRLIESERWALAEATRDQGLYPYFKEVQSPPEAEITVAGQRRLNMASNGYLSLGTHPRVKAAAIEATKYWGTSVSGSRMLNGTLSLHLELEEALRAFYGVGRAIALTTGYGTNLALLAGLLSKHDVAIVDSEAHNSIQTGLLLSGARIVKIKHQDLSALATALDSVPDGSGCVVVVDGVYSMSGHLAPLREIVNLCRQHPDALLVVDEAHGLGVCGDKGRGAVEQLDVLEYVDFITITFSKSLGSCGGAILGDNKLLDVLQFSTRMNPFLFTASNTPGSVAAALEALRVLQEEPQLVRTLRENVARFVSLLKERGVHCDPPIESAIVTVPLRRGDDYSTLRAGALLLNAGVYANNVVFPAIPAGKGLLRFSLMATHTDDQLRFAADTVRRVLENEGQHSDEIARTQERDDAVV